MTAAVTLKKIDHEFPDDWRGETMMRVRKLIHQADPQVEEDVKWKTASNPNGVLVWYHDGMILTGETYKQHLRLAFSKGPELKQHDPAGLINSHRAVLIHEEDTLNESAFVDLIKAAIALNQKKK